jgi:hypothetical protein
MGTIPTIPTVTAGAVGAAADFNQLAACVNFWSLTPRCYVYQLAATTLTTGVYGLLGFDAEVFDVANNYDGGSDSPAHDITTDNSRIYVRTTGKYEISGQVQFASNPTGQRRAMVRKNAAGASGGGTGLGEFVDDASTSTETGLVIPLLEVPLTAGDYLEVFARQSSGGNLATNVGSPGFTFLRIKLSGS